MTHKETIDVLDGWTVEDPHEGRRCQVCGAPCYMESVICRVGFICNYLISPATSCYTAYRRLAGKDHVKFGRPHSYRRFPIRWWMFRCWKLVTKKWRRP